MILVAARGVGVARDIQPVTAPALPVAGRAQQALDDVLESVFRLVGHKIADFLFRRRQPGQIECRAPQQSRLVGRRRGGQTVRFEFGENKAVDGRTHPIRRLDLGRRLARKRAKGPEIAVLGGDLAAGIVRPNGRGLFNSGPGGALRQPPADGGDLFRPQAALRRHLDALLVTQRLQQQAAFRLAGGAEKTRSAGREIAFGGLQIQSGALYLLVVAHPALAGQDRADLLFEKLERVGGGACLRRSRKCGQEEDAGAQHSRQYNTTSPLGRGFIWPFKPLSTPVESSLKTVRQVRSGIHVEIDAVRVLQDQSAHAGFRGHHQSGGEMNSYIFRFQ